MPPFKTTSELLAYAQENPQTLRDKWWEYYIAGNEGQLVKRIYLLNKSFAHCKNDESRQVDAEAFSILEALAVPIPCPHFIFRYTTNWLPLLDGLKLQPAEYHAACNIAAAQPKHSLTLCIQDAWKLTDAHFERHLMDFVSEDIYATLDETSKDLNLDANISEYFICQLINNVFTPAIAHQKEVFLAGHRERGLLNKKLFNS